MVNKGGIFKKFLTIIEIHIIFLSIFSFTFILFSTSFVKGSNPVIKKSTTTTPQTPQGGGGQTLTKTTKGTFGLFAQGGVLDSLFTGLVYGAMAYMAGQILGNILGFSQKGTQALSTALASGTFVWQGLATATGPNGFLGANFAWWGLGAWAPFGIGVVVSAIVFAVMYRDEKIKMVTFECKPWQPPLGGDNCEACNKGPLPCSEYRCRSLGQTCELVNPGTSQEKCVDVNPNDVSPPTIKPNKDVLTPGHKYTNVKELPPGPGFTIINTENENGCLKPFTPLQFGITTNEPSQCKIDFNHTAKFEEMSSLMGGSNLFLYNHTEKFALPEAKDLENTSLILENGKDITLFIRCMDKRGNYNSAEYAVKFCIDPSPDTTAPEIKATSILNNGCVAENQDNANVIFYTNEPAECRWSKMDQSFENMANKMKCTTKWYQVNGANLYACNANLSGIGRDSTTFYIRCKDHPGEKENERNVNTQSFKFSLRGSTALKMRNLQPNGTVFSSVSPAPVVLHVETLEGCDNGQAVCFYSQTGENNSYIPFYDTDKKDGVHTQEQDLPAGEYHYHIKCVDAGGNVAQTVLNFKVEVDKNPPAITRVYQEDGMLKITTLRESECSYTFDNCEFVFSEGTPMPYANSTTHVADWKEDKTFYIKCRDKFKNEPSGCSIIVRPTKEF